MKKRVEVVEPNNKLGWAFRDSGHERCFGDVFTSERGQYYIDLGWAKCTETGDCGERIEGASKIKPDNVHGTGLAGKAEQIKDTEK